jgi:hypothetical protein
VELESAAAGNAPLADPTRAVAVEKKMIETLYAIRVK